MGALSITNWSACYFFFKQLVKGKTVFEIPLYVGIHYTVPTLYSESCIVNHNFHQKTHLTFSPYKSETH